MTLIGARHMTVANCDLAVGSDVTDIAFGAKWRGDLYTAHES